MSAADERSIGDDGFILLLEKKHLKVVRTCTGLLTSYSNYKRKMRFTDFKKIEPVMSDDDDELTIIGGDDI